MKSNVLLVVLVLGILFTGLHAQEKAPSLSDVQKLSLIAASKDVDIAKLKLEAAQVALQRQIDAVVPLGYKLGDHLELVKIEKPVTEPHQ